MDKLIAGKINKIFQKPVAKSIGLEADLEPCQTSKVEFFAKMVKI